MKNRIYLSLAHMSGNEQKFIQEAFDTNWVVPLGPNVDGFEKDLEDYLGNGKHIVALSSGTAAIHLGLLQLGVGYGDEVICQSFTFAASANPIVYLGAKPVFVGSENETWNMSPYYLEEAVKGRMEKTGKKPKAIIPVHLYGMPAKMDEIMAVANRYEIPVLEDAAEALGSEYKGQKCGTFGEFACLSFNGNKIITTSGGGALVCSTEAQKKKTMFYATQARDEAPHYQHSEIGYNYRMSNICAGIGRGQMTILYEHVAKRRENHQIYSDFLKNFTGITVFSNHGNECPPLGARDSTKANHEKLQNFPSNPNNDFNSNYWLTTILINPREAGFTREDLRIAMEKANIETRPLWKPMHLQPVFKDAPFYGDGTSEKLFEQGLCLPSGPNLVEDDFRRIFSVLESVHPQPPKWGC